jgi:hypothetical protein
MSFLRELLLRLGWVFHRGSSMIQPQSRTLARL